METAEVTRVIKFLNASWPSSTPIDRDTAAIWGRKLLAYDFSAVMAVLDRMLETHKWRPRYSEIVEPLLPAPAIKPATEAFADVWEQIGKPHRRVTELEAEAVRRLGGWDVLGGWRIDERQWNAKRFADAYADVVESKGKAELRELGAGDTKALTDGELPSERLARFKAEGRA